MGSKKITHVHVYLIGFVIMVIVGVALYFLLLKPLNETNTSLATAIAGLKGTQASVDGQSFTYNQKEAAQVALEAAKSRKEGKVARLASLERKKQLPASQTLVIETEQSAILNRTMRRWLMLPERVVTSMERWAADRGRKLGLKSVETTFKANAPSTDPAAIPKAIVAWNLGPMTVTGDFNKVMRWVKDWNNAPLLVAVNDLKCSIADKDGIVTATASLNVYIFPTGPGAGTAAAGAVNVAGTGGGLPATGGAPEGGGNMPASTNGP